MCTDSPPLDFGACQVCSRHCYQYHLRRAPADNGPVLVCRHCVDEIRAELTRYRADCVAYWYDDDRNGWRAAETYRPDSVPVDQAVMIEAARRARAPWRTTYARLIRGTSTTPQ